jgi:hypothetical protein
MRAPARAAALLACLFVLAAAVPARAHSVFDVGGLGEPQNPEPARLRALGGAGAAEVGPREFSITNPASMADVTHLLIEGSIQPAWRRIQSATEGTEHARETTFPSLRGVIALPGGLVLGGAYVAGTSGTFRLDRDFLAAPSSHLRIEGTGGINFARLSLARRILPDLAVGLDYDIVTGSFREEWTRTFDDSSLVASRDTLETNYHRLGRFRFGAVATHAGFALGAVLETGRALPLEETVRTDGVSVTESKGLFRVPSGFVVGASAPVGGRIRVVGQYERRGYSRSTLSSDLVDFRAQQRVCVGVERKRSTERGAGLLDRVPIRLGGYHLAWPDLLPVAGATDITGGTAPIDEWGVTLGSGIVTHDHEGSVDFALEGGWRGDRATLGAREYFLRLEFSLKVSDETWKGAFH